MQKVKACQLEQWIKQSTADDRLPISRLSEDQYSSVIFYVDRGSAYRNVVREALEKGENYGRHEASCKNYEKILINPVDLSGDSSEAVTLTQLRAVVLVKHVLQLLSANG